MSHNCRQQLLSKQRQKDSTYDGQPKIVHHEEGVELEGFPIFHELSARKDRDIVRYEHCRRSGESRERRYTWYENELICGVPYDAGIELVELRP